MEKPDTEYAAVYQLGETIVRIDTSLAVKTPEERERAINNFKKALWDILEDEALLILQSREAK